MTIKSEPSNLKVKKINIVQSNVSGLILCGGAARRVGGEDKGLLRAKVDQVKPLIELQLAFLKPQVARLAISANRNLNIYRSYGFPVYQDSSYLDDKTECFDGPLQGILNGLKYCKTDWLYVQPIDTPNLPKNTIEQLIKRIKLSNRKAFYLISDERAHYLHILLHQSCYDSLNSFVSRGERRVKTYLEKVEAKAVNLGWEENTFKNLNDIKDYT